MINRLAWYLPIIAVAAGALLALLS